MKSLLLLMVQLLPAAAATAADDGAFAAAAAAAVGTVDDDFTGAGAAAGAAADGSVNWYVALYVTATSSNKLDSCVHAFERLGDDGGITACRVPGRRIKSIVDAEFWCAGNESRHQQLEL